MSVNLTVEIHGLCALLVKGNEATRAVCLAGGHTAVMAVPTANLQLRETPQYAADRIIVVGGTQYAEWDLAGCTYDVGDPSQGPAKVVDDDQDIFRMQSAYAQNANASGGAWDGPFGKLISARMNLYGGVVQPVTKTLAKLTLAPMANEPDYSHMVTDIMTFTATGAPDDIVLGNGKTIPLTGNPTISICNFGNMLENARFAHFEMYHALLQDQALPVRKVQPAGAQFVFPVDCVPPSIFQF